MFGSLPTHGTPIRNSCMLVLAPVIAGIWVVNQKMGHSLLFCLSNEWNNLNKKDIPQNFWLQDSALFPFSLLVMSTVRGSWPWFSNLVLLLIWDISSSVGITEISWPSSYCGYLGEIKERMNIWTLFAFLVVSFFLFPFTYLSDK